MVNRLAIVVAAAGFGAFLLSFAIVEWTISFYAHPTSQPHYQHETSEKSDRKNLARCEERPFWQRTVCDPVAAFTGTLTLFTATLAAFTLGVWWISWGESVRQSKEVGILQRAYLAVDLRGINPYRIDPEYLSCDLGIINAGNLPAQKVSWQIDRKFSTERWLTKFDAPTNKAGNVLIPPRGETIRSVRPLTRTELLEEETVTAGKQLWLYLWGRVEYLDGISKDTRFIEFCHRYNVNDVGADGVAAKYGRQHEYGNRTDQY